MPSTDPFTPRWRALPADSRRPRWLWPLPTGNCIFWPRPENRPGLPVRRCRMRFNLPMPWCRGMRSFQPWSLIRPPENDRRFTGTDWELPSFNLLAQAFLLTEQWWHSTTTDIHGLAHSNAAIADFALRQCLDTVAPTNFATSNPEVLRKIMETGGGNFVYGLHNWIEDWQALLAGRQAEKRSAIRGRQGCCRHARQGRLSQRADRADPVCADDADRAARTRADRACLDHEVLHSRPFAAQFAGALPGRKRLHRIHDLLEESDAGVPRISVSKITASSAWTLRSPPSTRSCLDGPFTPRAIASAARCCRSRRPDWVASDPIACAR